ncbi:MULTISPECIES: tyrosine-type recombinase/integrase [Yersinia]|uniref:tyrosine-type recombinase/integrase n=1 Tax=Yersinia TaxID=629 RepID=UPI001F08F593|nr:tyrosine-type recombinase/integrase [Yersinia sp. IP36721]
MPGALNADSLTKAFVKALKATDLVYETSPPSFHEIHSLASRLYEAEYGKEFAQKLLGHKSMKMTNVYLDFIFTVNKTTAKAYIIYV